VKAIFSLARLLLPGGWGRVTVLVAFDLIPRFWNIGPGRLIDAAVTEAAFEHVEVIGELALDPFEIGQARTVGKLVEHPCGDQFGNFLDVSNFFARRTHGDLPWEQEAGARMLSARPPCGNGSVRRANAYQWRGEEASPPRHQRARHVVGFFHRYEIGSIVKERRVFS
jgi:hypothetical protein